ncbi:hypothetical protein A2U01_0041660 [Trifolium medium]|uniref:Uncharacterized protein n=1 Tax=Trifolium medium TaxID=97028 RepID=A0A392Q8N6_9FABA|nr:hypothetical protein [Trifolium medium]
MSFSPYFIPVFIYWASPHFYCHLTRALVGDSVLVLHGGRRGGARGGPSFHYSHAGLGWAGAPRNSLGNYADGWRSIYYRRGQRRGAGEELGRFLPGGGKACLLGVLR